MPHQVRARGADDALALAAADRLERRSEPAVRARSHLHEAEHALPIFTDEIELAPSRPRAGNVRRRTNRGGGTEGGMTTGEPLVIRAAMKPISTLMRPLGTVDVATGEAAAATVERSDVTAVPAMGVIAEAMVAFVLAQAWLEKFGGDSLTETCRNLEGYMAQVTQRLGG